MTAMPDSHARHGSPDSPDRLADLLSRSASGDEQAWREVLGLYARRVYAMARSRCRRDDLAEEITQSVFATVAEKLCSPDLPGGYTDHGRFEAWLFRVTMNRVRDEMRRQARHARPTDPSGFDSVESPREDAAGPDASDLGRLREALNELSDADREVVELRHHGQLSFKTMAAMLNEPVGTLLARHHRALRKLKAILEAAGVRPAAEQ